MKLKKMFTLANCFWTKIIELNFKKELQVPLLLMGNEQRVAVKQSGTVGLSRLSPAMSLPAHNMGKGKRSKNRQPKRRKKKERP